MKHKPKAATFSSSSPPKGKGEKRSSPEAIDLKDCPLRLSEFAEIDHSKVVPRYYAGLWYYLIISSNIILNIIILHYIGKITIKTQDRAYSEMTSRSIIRGRGKRYCVAYYKGGGSDVSKFEDIDIIDSNELTYRGKIDFI